MPIWLTHLLIILLVILMTVITYKYAQKLIYKKRFTIITGSKHFIGDEVEIAGVPCIVVQKGVSDFEGYYKYIFKEK